MNSSTSVCVCVFIVCDIPYELFNGLEAASILSGFSFERSLYPWFLMKTHSI